MNAAVLLSFHGSVERADDHAAFVANIRRGRPAPPEVLAEVRRRFEAIGGSPLCGITRAQAAALEARLGLPVRVAGRLWGPYPKEVIGELVAGGIDEVVSLPLAPQSVHVYHAAVKEVIPPGVGLRCVPSYGEEPALIDAFWELLEGTLAEHADTPPAEIGVVLSAHSLPRRVVDAGDPYERDFLAMAARVASRAEARGHRTAVAFQSQGMTGDAWLGPDLATTFAHLGRSGVSTIVVAPIGFVAEHTETLYDLDLEAKAMAARAKIARFARVPALNDRPRFIDALELVARRALAAPPAEA